MTTLNEIRHVLDNHKLVLYSKYSIKSLGIFGSYSRAEENDQSDLDLGVEFNENIGSRFIDLADELENIVGVKVDLVSKKGIKEKYYQSIQHDVIYV